MSRPISCATALIAAALPCAGGATPAFYPDFMALSAPLYAEQPDIPACLAGRLHAGVGQGVLDSLNDIRKRHGLAALSLDPRAEQGAEQAALMSAANGKLNHNPPPSWRCYSAAGANAMASSIISGGVTAPNIAFLTPEQDIIAWLIDNNSLTGDNIGHRRWLLDPFVKTVAYGRVSGKTGWRKLSIGSALTLNHSASAATAGPELIAYPYQDYPARYFADGAVLSISVLVDKQRKQGNAAVDFSEAEIRVVTEQGSSLRVRNVTADNHYFGLPNSLQFKLGNIAPGIRHEVSVTGVRIQGVEKSYRYWFRIIPE